MIYFIALPCCLFGLIASLRWYGPITEIDSVKRRLMRWRSAILFAPFVPLLLGTGLEITSSTASGAAATLIAAMATIGALIGVTYWVEQAVLCRTLDLQLPKGTTLGSLLVSYIPMMTCAPLVAALGS